MQTNETGEDIYNVAFVGNLFNRMANTYGLTNYLASFGFTARWRKQCIQGIEWQTQQTQVYDFMSGMGECWHLIVRQAPVRIVGIDLSNKMNQKAKERSSNWEVDIEVRQENVLENTLEPESADCIISTFGLKTFSPEQQDRLARETARLLKPNGQFSFVEISVPPLRWLRTLYFFYLKKVIPLIGWSMMGNAPDYRMLGTYCEKFGNCTLFAASLRKYGMDVEYQSYFFGCASGVRGRRPGIF